MNTTANDMNFAIKGQMERMIERQRERDVSLRHFLSTQPQTRACQLHQKVQCSIDFDGSQRETFENGGVHTTAYARCSVCMEVEILRSQDEQLHDQGVPSVLRSATLDNWIPQTQEEQQHLSVVREFSKALRGFLILLGDVGTGKSHLAVGTMRQNLTKGCWFIRQSDLLRELRETYRDTKAGDPVKKGRRVGLLVLDDMGLSSGGRDEFSLLHDILDSRYGERLPTIITANIGWNELRQLLGERLADRLKESAYKVRTFSGPSHRAGRRQDYFADVAGAGQTFPVKGPSELPERGSA